MAEDFQFGSVIQNLLGGFGRPQQQAQPAQRPGFAPGESSPREMADWVSGQGTGGNMEQRFARTFNRSFQGATEEGFRLRDVEDQRINEARGWGQHLEEVMDPVLTQGDIQDLYAGVLNDVARQKMRDTEAIAEYTGQSGMRGNAMADLFATAENEAFAAASRGMADLRKHMADLSAQHQITKTNAALAGAQLAALPPSLLGLNTLIQGMETSVGGYGAEREYRAAMEASKAQQQSSMFGGLLGVAGSLLGGLF